MGIITASVNCSKTAEGYIMRDSSLNCDKMISIRSRGIFCKILQRPQAWCVWKRNEAHRSFPITLSCRPGLPRDFVRLGNHRVVHWFARRYSKSLQYLEYLATLALPSNCIIPRKSHCKKQFRIHIWPTPRRSCAAFTTRRNYLTFQPGSTQRTTARLTTPKKKGFP